MGTMRCGHSLIIYRHWVCKLFIKILIIISISINVHSLYVGDPLGLYISLVSNSIELIMVIDKTY